MARNHLDMSEDLQTMVNSFRVSDLQSLMSTIRHNRNGRKNELLQRAIEILRKQPPDVNMETFKRKIRELYRAAQEEAKQTHNLELAQQHIQMQHALGGNRTQHQSAAVIAAQHANAAMQQQQQQRPLNTINPYGTVPSPSYHHQTQQQPRTMPTSNPYQGGGMSAMGANSYSGTTVYNQFSAPTIQPTIPTTFCNFGNTVIVVAPPTMTVPPNYSQAVNVVFRKLPFYKLKYEILKPTYLNANQQISLPPSMRTTAALEFQYTFVLTCEMASEIAMNRDISNNKSEYQVQALLRISSIDTNVSSGVSECDDFLPLGLVVRLNTRQCQLPNCSPSARTGTESRRIPRPINITPSIRLSPMNSNALVINWAQEAGKTFLISLNIVEKLSSESLLNKLKEKSAISVESTKLMIRQQYRRVINDDDDNNDENADADDDDIATTIVRVSLLCPLVKYRMAYPAKGKNCSHLQCFDGSAYINLNEKRPTWMCPVCNRTLYYDDLLIDQYFVDVLNNADLSDECQEVQLLVDGTWKSYNEENVSNNDNGNESPSGGNGNPSVTPTPCPNQESSVVNLSEMAINDVDIKEHAIMVVVSDNGNAGGPVVDLTAEEEDEEEDVAQELVQGSPENINLAEPNPVVPVNELNNETSNTEMS